jgi:hypothetical protein
MRYILIGCNSKLYNNFKRNFNKLVQFSISHKEIHTFLFRENDIVIVLSYGKNKQKNKEFYKNLSKINVGLFIILSTTSSYLANKIKCYEYPSNKLYIENLAIKLLKRHVVIRAGVIVNRRMSEEFQGLIQTPISKLIKTLKELKNIRPVKILINLGQFKDFKNKNSIEYYFYLKYKLLIHNLKYPCIIRPLDLILKVFFSYKWYGYGLLTVLYFESKNEDL